MNKKRVIKYKERQINCISGLIFFFEKNEKIIFKCNIFKITFYILKY